MRLMRFGRYKLVVCLLIIVFSVTATSGTEFPLLREFSLGSDARGICFSEDGQFLVVTLGYRDLAVYNTTTWETQWIDGNRAAVPVCSANPMYLLSVPYGSRSLLVDTNTWEFMDEIDGDAQFSVISPDGEYLATSNGDFEAAIWDLDTCQRLHTLYLRLDPSSTHIGGDLTFTPDGSKLVASGWRATAIWDAETGEEIAQLEYMGFGGVLSPDGVHFATYVGPGLGASPGEVSIRSIEDEYDSFSFDVGDSLGGNMSFTPDGTFIAVPIGPDVKLYVTANGSQVGSLEGDPVQVSATAISPDGNWLAAVGVTDTLRLWDISSLQDQICSGFRISKVDWTEGSVTIQNTTSNQLDLIGWKISDGGRSYTFETSTLIAPGEAFVATRELYNPRASRSALIIDDSDRWVHLYSPEACGASRESSKHH